MSNLAALVRERRLVHREEQITAAKCLPVQSIRLVQDRFVWPSEAFLAGPHMGAVGSR